MTNLSRIKTLYIMMVVILNLNVMLLLRMTLKVALDQEVIRSLYGKLPMTVGGEQSLLEMIEIWWKNHHLYHHVRSSLLFLFTFLVIFVHRTNNNISSIIMSRALVINLGMPKMGSSSIHSYFDCGGYKSVHWLCGGRYCGDCIQEAIQSGLPPFSSQDPKCKINSTIGSYAQIDRGPENLVQVNYLTEIMSGVPRATFILTFRNMTKWYMSMSRWGRKDNNLRKRFEVANITGLPKGVGRNVSEFSQFYCEYVKRVRKEVAKYPGRHELIEIDIEDPSVGWQMEDLFGVNRTCWGISNAANHNDAIPTEQLQRWWFFKWWCLAI